MRLAAECVMALAKNQPPPSLLEVLPLFQSPLLDVGKVRPCAGSPPLTPILAHLTSLLPSCSLSMGISIQKWMGGRGEGFQVSLKQSATHE